MKGKWIVAALAVTCAIALVMGCENEPTTVEVESVTVAPSTLTLGAGDTYNLNAWVEPLNAEGWTLTWESSNDDVATMSGYFKLMAVGVGTAIITAKAGGKQGTCEVNVHVHSYSEGKCTVCKAKLKIKDCYIGDGGVLTRYYGEEANVVIPETVTGIGKDTFYGNTYIESVTIPGSVKSIESADSKYGGAFYFCKKLKTVTMCEGVESIGDYAFYECKSLASVTIPASVTSIGVGAFGWTSLEEIQFEGTKEQWNAIKGSDNVGIHGIRCSDGHIGVLGVPAYLTLSGTEVTGYSDIYDLPANVVIPEGITGIGESAFFGCYNLKKVTIPDGVESIEDSVFSGCESLASVTIPASVTSIGNSAFSGCTKLMTVNYGGTKEQWANIKRFKLAPLMPYCYDGLSGKTITGKDGSTWVAE